MIQGLLIHLDRPNGRVATDMEVVVHTSYCGRINGSSIPNTLPQNDCRRYKCQVRHPATLELTECKDPAMFTQVC